MIHIYPVGFHLALDVIGVGLILAALVLVIAGTILLLRHRDAALVVGVFVAASVSAIFAVHRATMAPAHAWPVILAAYGESSGRERLRRTAELRAYSVHGHIRESYWLELSRTWGVCHAMWYERGCRRPPGPYEAQGIAREMLQKVAEGGS